MDSGIKKPLTIRTRKRLFYMVGPHGRKQLPTLLFLINYLINKKSRIQSRIHDLSVVFLSNQTF